jgi:hypothetical protein
MAWSAHLIVKLAVRHRVSYTFLSIYALKLGKVEQKRNSLTKSLDKKSCIHKQKKGRHFTVLPKGLGDRFGGMERWERVDVEGVEDEVAAHLGVFSPTHNLGYEGLIQSVGRRIFEWCEDLLPPKT